MIISKDKFVEIINRLKNYNNLQDKINDLFKENIDNKEADFMNAGSICIGHESVVIELLENMFNDKDTISWWIYELDFGRKYKDGYMTDKEGEIIDLSTAEKLYDYLIENIESEVRDE